MKVIVFGTRGIPDIPGGVETHCQELYPRMADGGIEIELIVRSSYVPEDMATAFKGVRLKKIYAPRLKSLEAIIHSLLALIYALKSKPDIVHIHAVGPNLVTPLARLFNLKVVMTHHGPDYKRKKWGTLAKLFLKLGEMAGVKFANKVIVISEEIQEHIATKLKRQDSDLIPNGVPELSRTESFDHLQRFGLQKGKYILTLGRFVPEKGFDYLIRAYKKSAACSQYKLVIAGDADHPTIYSRQLKDLAIKEGIVLPGFLKGEALKQLFSHTSLFVLPSFYEGLPIALLEAMSYRVNILASNIKANTQIGLPPQDYFEAGNEELLSRALNEKIGAANQLPDYDLSEYDWDRIAERTKGIYYKMLGARRMRNVAVIADQIR